MVSKATLRASACPSLRICAAVGFLGLGRLERVEGAGEETEAVALPLRLRRVAEDEASATASDESEEGGVLQMMMQALGKTRTQRRRVQLQGAKQREEPQRLGQQSHSHWKKNRPAEHGLERLQT
jgi:hypothetical protein